MHRPDLELVVRERMRKVGTAAVTRGRNEQMHVVLHEHIGVHGTFVVRRERAEKVHIGQALAGA